MARRIPAKAGSEVRLPVEILVRAFYLFIENRRGKDSQRIFSFNFFSMC
jgi:hypothetical protein